MDNYCVCGKWIRPSHHLCHECGEIYGYDRDEWPEWLKFQVADIQREYNADRNHPEVSLVQNPRSTLLERYDDNGIVILRGCRNFEGDKQAGVWETQIDPKERSATCPYCGGKFIRRRLTQTHCLKPDCIKAEKKRIRIGKANGNNLHSANA